MWITNDCRKVAYEFQIPFINVNLAIKLVFPRPEEVAVGLLCSYHGFSVLPFAIEICESYICSLFTLFLFFLVNRVIKILIKD